MWLMALGGLVFVLSSCSASPASSGPLSGPVESAEKCTNDASPSDRSIMYTTMFVLEPGTTPVTVQSVKLIEPENLELLSSSLMTLSDEMPLAIGSPESADEIWPTWKLRVPISEGEVTEKQTLLVNEVRRADPEGPDGSASGLTVTYKSDGRTYIATSSLGVRSAAREC